MQKQNNNSGKFRPSEYFDLIGGTSIGSNIASCLTIGMSVKEIKDMDFVMGFL